MLHFWKPPPGWKFSEIVWKKDVVKQLQHDLELGPSSPMHPTALVNIMYNARQSDWPLLDNDRSPQLVNPAEIFLNGAPALHGDQMVTYDYDNAKMPYSFSNEDVSSSKSPWRLDPGQISPPSAEQYFGYSVTQEHGNATNGNETWMKSEMWSDVPNANDMLA